MIDWHPVIYWYIFGVREILLVDHGAISCTWGLISCVSLDIYQCLHILFQDICVLLWPRSCRVIIELADWLCRTYLHVSLCWLHRMLYGRRGAFSPRRVCLALRSCLFVQLPALCSFVFEPNLRDEALIWVSVSTRNNDPPYMSCISIFHEIKRSTLLLFSDHLVNFVWRDLFFKYEINTDSDKAERKNADTRFNVNARIYIACVFLVTNVIHLSKGKLTNKNDHANQITIRNIIS